MEARAAFEPGALSSPALGKIQSALFTRVIYPRLGRPDPSVLVGPRHGVDLGIVDLGGGQVMAMTADPFYVVPAFGWRRAGWFAVHILASDLTTSGLPPRYLAIDLNLPPSMREEDLAELWDTVHRECEALGIAVVTGHTGRYQGCEFPMIGGCTMIGVGPADRYVVSGMSRPGDAVIMTKGAAIEAAGLMAASFPNRVASALGQDFARRADQIFWQMSTVRDALTAASVGVRGEGVTAMHDATECGVYGGLHELALAARVGMEIEVEAIPISDEVARICELFQLDPYTSISEGTLLLTCVPRRVPDILAALARESILACEVGRCTRGLGVTLHKGHERYPLAHPQVDPFWEAFAREAAR